MQRVHRHVLDLAEIADLLAGPVEQGRDLDEVALQHSPARTAPRSPDWSARSPVTQAAASASARSSGSTLRIAQQSSRAALLSIEAVDPGIGDPGGERPRVGMIGADAPAVALLGLLPELVGRREQPARVQGHHLDVEAAGEDEMGQRLVLEPEAGREHDPARHRCAQRGQPLQRRIAADDGGSAA